MSELLEETIPSRHASSNQDIDRTIPHKEKAGLLKIRNNIF